MARQPLMAAWLSRIISVTFVASCMVTLAGCAAIPEWTFNRQDVPPLEINGEVYTVDDAQALPDIEVLAINDEMVEFVDRYTRNANNERNKLMALHWAIKGAAGLDMKYDPFADGDAQQVFARGTANCLSYAHLFVAMAREAGLNARYQWMEVRPEWHRMGERIAVRLHVNVQVKTRDGSEYLVDIDPLSRSEVAGARLLSDKEGLALYYNNLAMMALADDRPGEAWMKVVKGLEVAPDMSQLWVNLGAIYRYSGQLVEAEQAYFRALDIYGGDRSAMNNLVVLYEQQGRDADLQYWRDRLNRYRDLNPYYHASLGDKAMEEQDWKAAHKHYATARRLQPEDSQLIYNLGLAEYHLGNSAAAEKLISKAIEEASFQMEKQRYRVQLRTIKEEQAASL